MPCSMVTHIMSLIRTTYIVRPLCIPGYVVLTLTWYELVRRSLTHSTTTWLYIRTSVCLSLSLAMHRRYASSTWTVLYLQKLVIYCRLSVKRGKWPKYWSCSGEHISQSLKNGVTILSRHVFEGYRLMSVKQNICETPSEWLMIRRVSCQSREVQVIRMRMTSFLLVIILRNACFINIIDTPDYTSHDFVVSCVHTIDLHLWWMKFHGYRRGKDCLLSMLRI